MFITISVFFILIFLLGFGIIHILKLNIKDLSSRIILYFGIGITAFPLLSVCINLIRIPLDWKVFLIVGLICALYGYWNDKKNIKQLWSEIKTSNSKNVDWYAIGAIICTLIVGWIMFTGAYAYPYLEDDDPWGHATSASYIAHEKTSYEPTYFNFQYIDPYPPSLDILMGVLHQTNTSMYNTLKLINVILLSLAILFFYIFAIQLFSDKGKALWATICLAAMPCFMSHFIWSQTLALTIMPIALYSLIILKKIESTKKITQIIKEHKEWIIMGSIAIGSMVITQPSTTFNFMLFVAGIIIIVFITKGWKPTTIITIAVALGCLISGIYWFDMIARYGVNGTLEGIGLTQGLVSSNNEDTSGGLVYSLTDFIIAPMGSKIDQGTGIGIVISCLAFLALIIMLINYKKVQKSSSLLIMITWLIITIIGTQGNVLPIKLFPHRFWAFLAIPVALLAAEGIVIILNSIKEKNIKYVIMVIILIGIITTSAYPKYVVQTANWPPGVRWTSYDEVALYGSIKQMPPQTKVFMFTPGQDSLVIGFDGFSCTWCPEIVSFKEELYGKSLNDIHAFLQEQEYKYMIISGLGVKEFTTKYGENKSIEYLSKIFTELQNSTKFTVVNQNKAGAILQIN